jgi:hypothetical protein
VEVLRMIPGGGGGHPTPNDLHHRNNLHLMHQVWKPAARRRPGSMRLQTLPWCGHHMVIFHCDFTVQKPMQQPSQHSSADYVHQPDCTVIMNHYEQRHDLPCRHKRQPTKNHSTGLSCTGNDLRVLVSGYCYPNNTRTRMLLLSG